VLIGCPLFTIAADGSAKGAAVTQTIRFEDAPAKK
jgi:hypothetical protein